MQLAARASVHVWPDCTLSDPFHVNACTSYVVLVAGVVFRTCAMCEPI
jgi:hypothetical protein